MIGFRFFWTLSVALCLCLPHWEQAHAADLQLVAAAKRQSERKLVRSQSGAKEKRAVKPAAASPKSKAASAKSRRRELLEPASADLPQNGIASWVGSYFEGRPVAYPGERHIMESFTAAHRAIAFNTILKVTDLYSGRSVLVRVNDRGPYIRGRIIDLARAAAEYLGYVDRGVARVRLEFAGNDKDPAQRYYIRMGSSKGAGMAGLVRGFGPFDTFDEAAALFLRLYTSCPDAELLAVREQS
jgi:rare lipoprotein A